MLIDIAGTSCTPKEISVISFDQISQAWLAHCNLLTRQPLDFVERLAMKIRSQPLDNPAYLKRRMITPAAQHLVWESCRSTDRCAMSERR